MKYSDGFSKLCRNEGGNLKYLLIHFSDLGDFCSSIIPSFFMYDFFFVLAGYFEDDGFNDNVNNYM